MNASLIADLSPNNAAITDSRAYPITRDASVKLDTSTVRRTSRECRATTTGCTVVIGSR
jgi:hypothetical protein